MSRTSGVGPPRLFREDGRYFSSVQTIAYPPLYLAVEITLSNTESLSQFKQLRMDNEQLFP